MMKSPSLVADAGNFQKNTENAQKSDHRVQRKITLKQKLNIKIIGLQLDYKWDLHDHKINCFELQLITSEIYMITKLTVALFK